MQKKNDDVNKMYLSQPVFSFVCLLVAAYSSAQTEVSLWLIFPCVISAVVLWFFCEVQPIIQEQKFKDMHNEMLATIQNIDRNQSETVEFLEKLKKVYVAHEQKYWKQIHDLEDKICRYHSTLEGLKNLALVYAYASSTNLLYMSHRNNIDKVNKYIWEAMSSIDRLEKNPKHESTKIEALLKTRKLKCDRAMSKAIDRSLSSFTKKDRYATCAICDQYLICPGCKQKRQDKDILLVMTG